MQLPALVHLDVPTYLPAVHTLHMHTLPSGLSIVLRRFLGHLKEKTTHLAPGRLLQHPSSPSFVHSTSQATTAARGPLFLFTASS